MKMILRTFLFSGVSLYLTSLMITSFHLSLTIPHFLLSTVLLAIVYYVVKPLTNIILLPLNLITFGLLSLIAYIAIFSFVLDKFSLATIAPWHFPGFKTSLFSLRPMTLNYWITVSLCAISYSSITNFLQKII